ncbi:MAG TPA: SRPBCC domain-containing protein [Micrococcaceae bacterium]|jgi:uncharacterized protein YndB with AHSA1/START domain|nr:SRPBCC domain-containing protein [Micrococcaceae bacterium]
MSTEPSQASANAAEAASKATQTQAPPVRPGESAVVGGGNTLTITRIFEAPRELVFQAWTDPDQLAQWWGPEQLHTPRESVIVEPQVGGTWAATMVMDDGGQEFPTSARFTSFDPPKGFAMHDEPNEFFPFASELKVDFEEVDGGTRMTIVQHFDTESFDFGDSILGWGTSLEKLRRLLAA